MALEQYVDWSEIESLVLILSDLIRKSSRLFSTITTLSRGGLIPARLLADHLGIQKILVDPTTISSDSLVVDDIFDSGHTFNKIQSLVDDPSRLFFVTLFVRRGKQYPKQLVYAKQTNDDGYVVFPWDKLEFQNSLK
ncbi:MAG: phosphoribosyltransferase [Nitrosopumilales archaeon CG_4_9_14_0_2_um_filter_34_16]|nr:MAG: phosphoribosyltransferase [Nitrosopumilales archaeon CG_4_9_14_0_2_um_filter_34_16]